MNTTVISSKFLDNCNNLINRPVFHDYRRYSLKEVSHNWEFLFVFVELLNLLISEDLDFFPVKFMVLNHFSHQKSLLKETLEHHLLINCPTSQRLELSVHMTWVTLQFVKEFTFNWSWRIEFIEENKSNVVIKLQVNTCLLLDSTKLTNQFFH